MPIRSPGTVPVVAFGGALGSVARYGLGRAWPDAGHAIAWTTLSINLFGSLLLGMLVVAVNEIWQPHPLTRPLLGTGVLGGFTTFSTLAVQTRSLDTGPALAYLTLSVFGGLLAAAAGMALFRQLTPRRQNAAPETLDPDLP